LNLRLLVHAQQHEGFVRRIEIQPDDVAHFVNKQGSFDNLNVFTRCGSRAKARQIRLTAVWLRPQRLAIARVY